MIRRFGAATMLALTFLSVSPGEAQETSGARSAEQTPEKLDLRIPDITELYTHEQIQAFLAPTFREDAQEVEVRGRREAVTPNVWPGIAAPFWAIFNPAQAWRIIAPFPPDQARALAFNADVTTPYQEPAARTAADLGSTYLKTLGAPSVRVLPVQWWGDRFQFPGQGIVVVGSSSNLGWPPTYAGLDKAGFNLTSESPVRRS